MKAREIVGAVVATAAIATGCEAETPAATMKYDYQFEAGINPGLAEVQRQLGENAVQSVTSEAMTFTLNGMTYQGTMRVPKDEGAQLQHLLFSPDSRAHVIKSDLSVKADENGVIRRVGDSRTIIGQEDQTGAVYSATFGYCEALELDAQPPIKDALTYDAAVDLVCRGIANAAEYSVGDSTYGRYVTDVNRSAEIFQGDPLPVVSESQFNQLTLD